MSSANVGGPSIFLHSSLPTWITHPADLRWVLHGALVQPRGTPDRKDGLQLFSCETLNKRYMHVHVSYLERVLDEGFPDAGVVYTARDSVNVSKGFNRRFNMTIVLGQMGKQLLLSNHCGPLNKLKKSRFLPGVVKNAPLILVARYSCTRVSHMPGLCRSCRPVWKAGMTKSSTHAQGSNNGVN